MAYTNEDKQNHIREIQNHLRHISATNEKIPVIIVDGVYDAKTRNAVSIFQQEYGIPQSGEVDSETWDALVREYRNALIVLGTPAYIYPFSDGGTVVVSGDDGALVYIIQAMLVTISDEWDNLATIEIDGIYGEKTASAVKDFQRLSGLSETGIIDAETWNRLARTYNSSNAKK